jgi:hypothetical protein
MAERHVPGDAVDLAEAVAAVGAQVGARAAGIQAAVGEQRPEVRAAQVLPQPQHVGEAAAALHDAGPLLEGNHEGVCSSRAAT